MTETALTWLAGALAVAALALAVVAGVQTWRLGTAELTLATERQARAEEHQLATDAALDAEKKYRTLERTLHEQRDEAQRQLDQALADSRRRELAFRSDADRLRLDLATFAAGGGRAAEDSLAACRADAAALGDVLGEALRVQVELAGAAESHAASTRTLLEAWPVAVMP